MADFILLRLFTRAPVFSDTDRVQILAQDDPRNSDLLRLQLAVAAINQSSHPADGYTKLGRCIVH